jgi:uncharacterized protein (UPF0261 family)
LSTILCIATLDTKGAEAQYVRELIEKRGHTALLMDVSCLEGSTLTPDITAREVAQAAGSTIQAVSRLKEAGPAAQVMTAGAVKIARDLYHSGKLDGAIAIGGGMGTSIASAVMRELPTGVPKFILSSQKIVQAGIKGYVGTKNIAVMPSLADIAGLNTFTKQALSNAVGAIVGMVESPKLETTKKPMVFMTMLGPTTKCGLKVKSHLEDKGYEVIIFHSIGIGGMTLEELLQSYPVQGVIELGLNEIGNELFGGFATAGPHRLEAAGKKGIPQIVTGGNVDYINFLTPDTVPDRYKSRNLHAHNPQATIMRLNMDELRQVGKTIAQKLNQATGPVKVLIPKRGFSSLDVKGGIFYDPVANKTFIDSLRSSLDKAITVEEIDAHINDDKFAQTVVAEFISLLEIA